MLVNLKGVNKMKTSLKSLVSLCAIYFLASGAALAGPAEISISEGGCVLINQELTAVVTGDLREVSSNNQNGNATTSCTHQFEFANDPKRAIVYSFDNTGARCDVGGVLSKDWHQVINANGKAKLTCHHHD
jgi:hypothetical protein